MKDATNGYRRILVAMDFSLHAETALLQAVWLARKSHTSIFVAHVLGDLRDAVISASEKARLDFFYGEGQVMQREIRQKTDDKMRRMIRNLDVNDVEITCGTLVGTPRIKLTQAVLAEKYDLVLLGTRGLSSWASFFVGSTAHQLIRNCPASVWTVKTGSACPPKVVLAATDFSEVSGKAVREGFDIAQQSNAEFHLLHVIDSGDVPEEVISQITMSSSMRHEIDAEVKMHLDKFLQSLSVDRARIQCHLTWGTPWREISRHAMKLHADLLVMGTIGRTGMRGILLGNTAERVLNTSDCSLLTVKPKDYVSPIEPSIVPLFPEAVEQ